MCLKGPTGSQSHLGLLPRATLFQISWNSVLITFQIYFDFFVQFLLYKNMYFTIDSEEELGDIEDVCLEERNQKQNMDNIDEGDLEMGKIEDQHINPINICLLKNYTITHIIYKKDTADIYLAHNQQQECFALKHVKYLHKSLISESVILEKISHPNIVKYYGEYDVLEPIFITKQNHQIVNRIICMEYAKSGDLCNYLVKYAPLSEKLVKRIIKQLVEALTYLHDNSIAHGDLKPDNILITNINDMSIKICDFAQRSAKHQRS